MSQLQLSDFEKGKIVAYSDCGLSLREIGKKLNRNHTSIGTFLNNYKATGNYDQKSGRGRKRATTASDDKKIIVAVKQRRTMTAQEIKTKLNLNVSTKTITLRRLHENMVFQIFFKLKKILLVKRIDSGD